MDRYVSHVTSRVDAKGRVSIPATFRSVLARDGHEGLFLHPTLGLPALDAGGNRLLAEIENFLSGFPPYSDERDQLATAMFATSEILKIDGEGRIGLTETVRAQAGLSDMVTFVGLGHKFQIWEPNRFRAHLSAAQDRVRDVKAILGRGSAQAGPASTQLPGARAT